MMKEKIRVALDVLLYIVVFFMIQYVAVVAVGAVGILAGGGTWRAVGEAFLTGGFQLSGKTLVASTVLSSLFTLCLFAKVGWAPVSRTWLRSRPWGVLVWAGIAALGTILPSEWMVEQMEYAMPEATEKLFEQIMGEPLGYLAIGMFAPLAEEMVFRGAVLRRLLALLGGRRHWVAIVISAVVFGAVHGNLPQFVHATLIGLLLGWMYCRTGSILPGVMFHWVNNTVAYAMFNFMPQMADGKLIDLFHGDTRMMVLGIIFSLFILVPGVLQLNYRMRK